ncbi:MAG: hypothetical protein ACI4EQ_03715 [Lachnospiraceae bacterium]
MKLSDSFEVPTGEPALELKVIQLNINHGHNEALMEKCRTLREYAIYVERVRTYAQRKPLREAVEQAVTECMKEGILSRFLSQYKAEAISMSIFEYDEEREMKLIRQSERELGWEEGHRDGWNAGKSEGFATGMTAGKSEGFAAGMTAGKSEGIRAFITLCKELDFSEDETVSQLMAKFEVTASEARNYIERVKIEAVK